MAFGSDNHSNIPTSKKTVANEGAFSEQMHIKHMKEERIRVEKQRTKSALEEKKRQHDRNKLEISRRQTELRRINMELSHADLIVRNLTADMQKTEHDVGVLRAQYNDSLTQINKHKEELVTHKRDMEKENMELEHLAQQIRTLELKMIHDKEIVRQMTATIDQISSKIASLTNESDRAQVAVNKAHSDKVYKEKELEARKRTVATMNRNKDHETTEIQRLTSANYRLEGEIKSLEAEEHRLSTQHV